MTPNDFHQMIGLQCDGPIINLEGESGIQLGIDLLGKRHTTETICYFDLEIDHKLLPQEMPEDCNRMARAFFLYILRAYLFAYSGWLSSMILKMLTG